MLYTLEGVKAGVRTREGKRVFWLSSEDRLTPAARDWLKQENIEITTQNTEYRDPLGGVYTKKPEELTHLQGELLVPKTHRRIAFRGKLDALQAQVLLCGREAREPYRGALEQMLEYLRQMLRAEVLEQELSPPKLLGLDAAALREHSHYPQRYYGQTHFQPDFSQEKLLLSLNLLRTAIRETELACCHAFSDAEGRVTRRDLVQGLNRLSSACYILMLRIKGEKEGTWNSTLNK